MIYDTQRLPRVRLGLAAQLSRPVPRAVERREVSTHKPLRIASSFWYAVRDGAAGSEGQQRGLASALRCVDGRVARRADPRGDGGNLRRLCDVRRRHQQAGGNRLRL